jgi:hypothetical protein
MGKSLLPPRFGMLVTISKINCLIRSLVELGIDVMLWGEEAKRGPQKRSSQ